MLNYHSKIRVLRRSGVVRVKLLYSGKVIHLLVKFKLMIMINRPNEVVIIEPLKIINLNKEIEPEIII